MKYIDHINYKEGNIIYNFFNYKNHNNIIIYGLKNTGKTSLVKDILNDKFKNNEYYYFDCYKDTIMIDHIKDIVKTYNYYTNEFNYIVIDNYEKLKIIDQNCLKVMIEKSYSTTKFIIITENYNKIISAIRSRCISVRISFKSKETIDIHNKWINDEKHEKTFDIQRVFLDKLFIIYENFKLKDIKELCLKIKEINLEIIPLLKSVVNRIISNNYGSHKTMNSIKEISSYEHLLQKSYRNIIYLESLFIRLYYIIYENGLL